MKNISNTVHERWEEFYTPMKSQEGRNSFLWRRSRIFHFLVLPVKTLVDSGANLLSVKQFKPVSCLIAGGNLYDKILRQKDKLFEEEVIYISMEGS